MLYEGTQGSLTGAKEAAQAAINASREGLVALSHRIHANPELGYEEEQASGWLGEMLDAAGFTVEQGRLWVAHSVPCNERLRPAAHRRLCGIRRAPGHRPRLWA